MAQEIKEIKITDLCLWTENPRDPVDTEKTDEEIILRAIDQKNNKWELEKLIKEMGEFYDYSELPTVVKKNDKYIVYDGNRRVAIIKCSQNSDWDNKIKNSFLKKIPTSFKRMSEIPCNVCDEKIALINIERKHINSGDWKELERSYFLHHHKKKPKDDFIIIEESTEGIISANSKMNQRFVREELLTRDNLEEIGFTVKDEKLVSVYDDQTEKSILRKIVEIVNTGKTTTRTNRGELSKTLKENSDNSDLPFKKFNRDAQIYKAPKINEQSSEKIIGESYEQSKPRKTRRTKTNGGLIFGEDLFLKLGDTNDIYRDIVTLYNFYLNNKLSSSFPNLIMMSLRLLVESTVDKNNDFKKYIKKNFEEAKKTLDTEQKNTLAGAEVNESDKLIKSLNMGAHQYKASASIEKVLAMSIIIGAMLKKTHAKK